MKMSDIDLAEAVWRKSSFSSANGQCVEMASLDTAVAVRDSKAAPHGPALVLTPRQWRDFVAYAKRTPLAGR